MIAHFLLAAMKIFSGYVFTNFQCPSYVISVSPLFTKRHVLHYTEHSYTPSYRFIPVAPDITGNYNLYVTVVISIYVLFSGFWSR
jgi:hypothetical protein